MIRAVLFHGALFLAPFIVFAFYLYFSKRDPMDRSSWETRNTFWVLVVALVLLIGSLFLVSTFRSAETGQRYVPAHMEDGRLVPGRYE